MYYSAAISRLLPKSGAVARPFIFNLVCALVMVTFMSTPGMTASAAYAQSQTQDFELRTAGHLVNLCSELARMKGPGIATKNSRSIACQSYIAGAIDTVDSVFGPEQYRQPVLSAAWRWPLSAGQGRRQRRTPRSGCDVGTAEPAHHRQSDR